MYEKLDSQHSREPNSESLKAIRPELKTLLQMNDINQKGGAGGVTMLFFHL